ncbi:MAG: lipoate--protein ligase [Eubacteriales bacterium]
MIIYKSDFTDPYFNLASEQYLMDNTRGDIFMLWRNAPSVIIGCAQNAYAELDKGFIDAHGIPVVRRLSGGGAVFHDLGNVNFTFITDADNSQIDFDRFTAPIVAALRGLGADAETTGRNDISVQGMKVSGNAQCHRGGRILHHGTLLFDADISGLCGALRPDPEKLRSKGVSSVRSRVGNISAIIRERDVTFEMDALGFKQYIEASVSGGARAVTFSDADIAAISALRESKYSRWEWNWGRSREFAVVRRRYFPYGLCEISYTADAGVLRDVSVCGDFFGVRDISGLCESLIGVRCEREDIKAAASDVGCYINGASPEDIASLILG